MIDKLSKRFRYPYLFAVFPVALALAILSAAAQIGGWDFVAGMLILYSMMLVVLAIAGYCALYSLTYGRAFIRWWRIRSDGM